MSIWGIVPAAGVGSRIQPLAFSKELLPVGSRHDGDAERPRAVSEYVIERMVLAGATRICIVVSSGKSDIIEYYGATYEGARIAYVVQPTPAGLCDAIFQALPLVAEADEVVVGLPDTVWFPADGLRRLGPRGLEFLLFPVDRPELFDSVVTDAQDRVVAIDVKRADARSKWIWGAFKMDGRTLAILEALWRERGGADTYFGTLVNAWLERGGEAYALRAGGAYVDVGTLNGYREAIQLLTAMSGGNGAAIGESNQSSGGHLWQAPR